MERLPYEVLLHIARRLTREEQSQWALTNRFWCDWLRKECLFTKLHIRIPSTTTNLQNTKYGKLLDLLKDSYGHRTTHLIVSGNPVDPDGLLKIVDTFPNIDWLTWKSSYFEAKGEKFEEAINRWRHLKKIDQDSACFTSLLLSSPSSHVTQLESIVLKYEKDHLKDANISPSMMKFRTDVKNLKNAPNLQSLTVDTAYLFDGALSSIHEAAPHLKSLTLKNPEGPPNVSLFTISDNNGNEDLLHERAKQLDHLSIEDRLARYNLGHKYYLNPTNLMKFISETYTDLTSFSYFVYPDNVHKADETEAYDYLCTALSNWERLKTFCCNLCPLDANLLKIMKNNGVRLQDLTFHMDRDYDHKPSPYIALQQYSGVVRDVRTLCVQRSAWTGIVTDYALKIAFKYATRKVETIKFQAFKNSYGFPLETLMVALERLRKLKYVEAQMDIGNSEYMHIRRSYIKYPSPLVSLDLSITVSKYLLADDFRFYGSRVVNALGALAGLVKNIEVNCPVLEKFKVRISVLPGSKFDITIRQARYMLSFNKLLRLQEVNIFLNFDAYFEITIQHITSIKKRGKKRVEKFFTKPLRARSENATALVTMSANQYPRISLRSASDRAILKSSL